MAHDRYLIQVTNGRATVAQYLSICGGVTVDPALNWQELEPEAVAALEQAGGSLQVSGYYACPAALAERAEFFAGNACATITRRRMLFGGEQQTC